MEATEVITEAFKYHTDNMALPLVSMSSVQSLVGAMNAQPDSYYFSKDTMAFFGSKLKDAVLVGGGVVVERLSAAPEGVPQYKVTAFVSKGDRIESVSLKALETKAEAVALAESVVEVWPV